MNTMVALPIVAATPTTAPAMLMQNEDPVFEVIAAHKKAVAAAAAIGRDIDKKIAAADERVGPRKITILDMREDTLNACGMHPLVETEYFEIDELVPTGKYAKLNAFYKEQFDRRQAERSEFVGDVDAEMDPYWDAVRLAADQLVEVVPTSVSGLLTLLKYLSTAHCRDGEMFNDDTLKDLLRSLGKAARRLEREARTA